LGKNQKRKAKRKKFSLKNLFKWKKKKRKNTTKKTKNKKADWSPIISVLSILPIFLGNWFGLILLILLNLTAITLGILALREIKKNPEQRGKGSAWTGIWVSIFLLAIFSVTLIALRYGTINI